jgi:hypothetical protein
LPTFLKENRLSSPHETPGTHHPCSAALRPEPRRSPSSAGTSSRSDPDPRRRGRLGGNRDRRGPRRQPDRRRGYSDGGCAGPGDIIAAGGTLIVNGDVGGKVLAAGGEIDLNGNATNVLATGGTVRIGRDAVIERDAVISAGEVTNDGAVLGNLTVSANTFSNPGTAGNVTFEEREVQSGLALPGLFAVLVAIGFLILGLLIIRFLPGPFSAVVREVERSPVVRTVVGFVAIIVTAILLLIIAVTVIGLPVALVGGLIFIVSLMLSSLFVAYALGDVIASRTGWKAGPLWRFVLGFVILQILIFIPLLGALVQIIAVSLGYGGLLYALRGAYPPVRVGRRSSLFFRRDDPVRRGCAGGGSPSRSEGSFSGLSARGVPVRPVYPAPPVHGF